MFCIPGKIYITQTSCPSCMSVSKFKCLVIYIWSATGEFGIFLKTTTNNSMSETDNQYTVKDDVFVYNILY